MTETTLSDVETERKPLHSSDPILTKKSDLYGIVSVYPPDADPTQWGILSWLLTTEHDNGDYPGLRVYLRSDRVMDAYERPHFIGDQHKYLSE